MDTLSRRALLKAAGAAAFVNPELLRAASSLHVNTEEAAVSPFRFQVRDESLDELHRRLEQARLPEQETCRGWSEGVPLAALRSIMHYWRTKFDWRRCESTLNSFPQYRTAIEGLGIHFLHVRSPHPEALPLIISHGWPGSIIEFFEIIGPLTNPMAHGGRREDAFHVVAPSLPGFGFSDKPRERGWNVDRIASAWAELMRRLGYSEYVAQGGDWGAWVTTRLAQQQPAGLRGIHLNFPLVIPDSIPTSGLSPEEQRAADSVRHFRAHEFGFFEEQATRPQTIGYALTDSPAGLGAWIYEQFYEHTDPRWPLTPEQVLDDITLYWLTSTAASSARIYFEDANLGPNGGVVDLPVGCSIFPYEIYQAPRKWAEACYPRLIYWHEVDRGGHFAAFEQPKLFVQELRACFRLLREASPTTAAAAKLPRKETT